MKIMDKVGLILKQGYICDHCLGRQFAQLLEGYSNDERGRILRKAFFMSADAEMKIDIDESNITERFHSEELKKEELKKEELKKDMKQPKKRAKEKCTVCNGLFDNLGNWLNKIKRAVGKTEFKTFLVGTKLSSNLIENEEQLWEKVGIDYCEPLKAEINREVGKRVEKKFGKKADLKMPDINIILNLRIQRVKIEKNPLFIYGEYQKLRRGMPQTRWPGKYKTSVGQIIARPFLKKTKGIDHKLHGAGREDIDAKCLGWRPFVLEILGPVKRLDKAIMKKMTKKVNKRKSVKIRGVRFSNIAEVRALKEARFYKTYRALVETKSEIKRSDLKKLKQLVDVIKQRTPLRVLHRRSNRVRKRKVLLLKVKYKDRRHFLMEIKTEAGTYIKELISGDGGRTRPSVSYLLDREAKCKELDVVKIWYKSK